MTKTIAAATLHAVPDPWVDVRGPCSYRPGCSLARGHIGICLDEDQRVAALAERRARREEDDAVKEQGGRAAA